MNTPVELSYDLFGEKIPVYKFDAIKALVIPEKYLIAHNKRKLPLHLDHLKCRKSLSEAFNSSIGVDVKLSRYIRKVYGTGDSLPSEFVISVCKVPNNEPYFFITVPVQRKDICVFSVVVFFAIYVPKKRERAQVFRYLKASLLV